MNISAEDFPGACGNQERGELLMHLHHDHDWTLSDCIEAEPYTYEELEEGHDQLHANGG